MYPPKNRVDEPLGLLVIKIDHRDGSYQSCPNGMVLTAISTSQGEVLSPEKVGLPVGPDTEIFDFTTLEPIPEAFSILSGKPAIRYRSDNVELLLTPEECYRLASLALTPNEFFGIRDYAGDFYEIHDDFYHPETGEAFQPRNLGAPDFSGTAPRP